MLHVVDASDVDGKQKEVEVNKILTDLNLEKIPQIRINNKCDLVERFCNKEFSNQISREVWISAENNIGITELRDLINEELFNGIYKGWVSLESSLGKIRSKLFRMGCVNEEKISSTGQIYAHIDIGRDELDRFIGVNGFALCEDKDILLEN